MCEPLTEKTDNNCWIEVDLGAITHNARILRELAGPGRLLMICVKAQGYGHGLVPVAKAALAGGADRLCVADVEEGVALRQAGIDCPIQLLLQPPASSAPELHRYRLIPSLSSPDVVRGLAEALPGPLTVHVEVDTGMSRVDLKPAEAVDFLDMVKSTGKLQVEGLFSHFSSSHIANDPDARAFTLDQLKLFQETVAACRAAGHRPALTHMANSGATIHYPEAYLDMIRPGFLVYGMPRSWIRLPLAPAMSWKCRVQTVLRVKKGQGVGYDRAFISPRDTTLAAVAVGYAHGYPHQMSNKSQVLIRGQKAPVAGRVGMNQTVVDVGHIGRIRTGDEVVLIGTQGGETVSATDLSAHLKTTPAVISVGISTRVPRIYLSGPDAR